MNLGKEVAKQVATADRQIPQNLKNGTS